MMLCLSSGTPVCFGFRTGDMVEGSENPDNVVGNQGKVPITAADLINFLLELLKLFSIINDLLPVQAVCKQVVQHHIVQVQLDIQDIFIADHGLCVVSH